MNKTKTTCRIALGQGKGVLKHPTYIVNLSPDFFLEQDLGFEAVSSNGYQHSIPTKRQNLVKPNLWSATLPQDPQEVTKASESLKRDLRGSYQSKSKVRKRDRAQTLDHGPVDALRGGSVIPLASVDPTQITDSEVIRPGTTPTLQTEQSDLA